MRRSPICYLLQRNMLRQGLALELTAAGWSTPPSCCPLDLGRAQGDGSDAATQRPLSVIILELFQPVATDLEDLVHSSADKEI